MKQHGSLWFRKRERETRAKSNREDFYLEKFKYYSLSCIEREGCELMYFKKRVHHDYHHQKGAKEKI